ncbi:thioredoxin-like protein [Multifurca ochricompacta]|uniref:glutathione transferase n=1 Tax=Multifurca ochricompacta TaxID=376703 RepID=A0AAD4QNE3_9AGAM|nr:thioredoxin-like protein [Multifurca ochricompacta]
MLIVHHLNNSRSQRILWLLEELEVPYQIKFYQRRPDRRAPKEAFDLHPLGKFPIITDGDVTLAESGAIIQYIINKYANGRLTPPKQGELIDIYFTHFSEGSLMPSLTNRYIFSLVPSQAPFFLRPLLKQLFSVLDTKIVAGPLNANLKYVEDALDRSPTGWFAGGPNPTMADYMMSFGLDTVATLMPDLLGPKTKAWVARVHDRPAFKRVSAYIEGNPRSSKL